MATWQSLIEDSLRELGVLPSGASATTQQRNDAIVKLRRMLASWSAELGPVHYETAENLTWPASQSSRTIGKDGNFSTQRPVKVLGARFRSNGLDLPMDIYSFQGYEDIQDKSTTSGTPQVLAYNPTSSAAGTTLLGCGTLHIWPVPSAESIVRLTSLKPLLDLDAAVFILAADIVLPPGYEEAIMTNLAVRLAPEYGGGLDRITVGLATSSKAALVAQNVKLRPLQPDPMMPGARGGKDPRAYWVLE